MEQIFPFSILDIKDNKVYASVSESISPFTLYMSWEDDLCDVFDNHLDLLYLFHVDELSCKPAYECKFITDRAIHFIETRIVPEKKVDLKICKRFLAFLEELSAYFGNITDKNIFIVSDDFEMNSKNFWESYHFAQDIPNRYPLHKFKWK